MNKKRVIVYDIRITVHTDFMEDYMRKVVKNLIGAIQTHEADKGRVTKIELKEKVIRSKGK